MSTPTDPISAAVRKMHPPRYTVTEAARMVGRSADTLRRYRRTGVVVPSHTVAFGQTNVTLYDDDDIAALREAIKVSRPGRKKADA